MSCKPAKSLKIKEFILEQKIFNFNTHAEWILPIVSNYLDTADLSKISRMTKYVKKILDNSLISRKLYTSANFIDMPINKISYIHMLEWSDDYKICNYILPPNLIHLTFTYKFNQPLPQCFSKLINLTNLNIGGMFNQQILPEILPPNLTRLNIGGNFNKKLLPNSLPPNLIYFNLERSCDASKPKKFSVISPCRSSACNFCTFLG